MILILKKPKAGTGTQTPAPPSEPVKKRLVLKSKPAPVPEQVPIRQDHTGLYDGMCVAVRQKCGPNMLVPWYLMAAYAYYVLDTPLLSDAMFDQMARDLLAHYDEVEHRHKHLISRANLQSGTLLIPEYPKITIAAMMHLLNGSSTRARL